MHTFLQGPRGIGKSTAYEKQSRFYWTRLRYRLAVFLRTKEKNRKCRRIIAIIYRNGLLMNYLGFMHNSKHSVALPYLLSYILVLV